MKCIICNKVISKTIKTKVCVSCGSKTAYRLIKEGYTITKNIEVKT